MGKYEDAASSYAQAASVNESVPAGLAAIAFAVLALAQHFADE
jgi:hypothetical protein